MQPAALPPAWHLHLQPTAACFSALLDGSLRMDEARCVYCVTLYCVLYIVCALRVSVSVSLLTLTLTNTHSYSLPPHNHSPLQGQAGGQPLLQSTPAWQHCCCCCWHAAPFRDASGLEGGTRRCVGHAGQHCDYCCCCPGSPGAHSGSEELPASLCGYGECPSSLLLSLFRSLSRIH